MATLLFALRRLFYYPDDGIVPSSERTTADHATAEWVRKGKARGSSNSRSEGHPRTEMQERNHTHSASIRSIRHDSIQINSLSTASPISDIPNQTAGSPPRSGIPLNPFSPTSPTTRSSSPDGSIGLGPEIPKRSVDVRTFPSCAHPDGSHELTGFTSDPEGSIPSQRARRSGRLRWMRVIGCMTMLLLLAIGIGVGVGVPFSRRKSDAKSGTQEKGTMSGSGAVVIDLELVLKDKSKITGYFQRWDGVIELNEYFNNAWSGGPDSEDLNTTSSNFNGDSLAARDGTPLMALSYINQANELIWHVFYVTVDHYLSDWFNSNVTNNWSQGTLRSGNFLVSNSSTTGLTACVNQQWYGSPFNETGLGIRLYYGNSDDMIQELGWNLGGQTTWFKGANFPDGNGAGGFECTVRGSSITYLWMENNKGELQQMFYDFNLSAGTESHVVGKWVNGLTYSNILHNSAITAINDFTSTPHTKHVLVQSPNFEIVEHVSNGTAETDAWDTHLVVGTEKGINGTRIGSVILNTGISGAQELHVLFQTNSTNMVDFIRPLTALNWARKEVPVGS